MKNDFNIPRCMSTQHPDNAALPFFAQGNALTGEEEVREAYYAYESLDCDEQMWDHEGKEVDVYVVPKLLTRHGAFFRKKKLGKQVRLTLRVPNPERERASAKGLLEILESIPRSFDVAKQFYRQNIAPIFEVILPMTTNSQELNRIWHYYREFVSGKEKRRVLAGDVRLKDWIGEFYPKSINVIPLIEDKESLLHSDEIVSEFLKDKNIPYQRVFLARSDPALQYGSTTAVLLIKIALYRLHKLEKKVGIPIFPIVGVGSAPFRGHFKPTNVKSRLIGYPSVQTFSIQSAFKFDYPEPLVKNAIAYIKSKKRKAPIPVDRETQLIKVINKMSRTYARQVERLAALIGDVSQFVPPRRKRKLHVGLFGYTRAVSGKRMPRAIGFCAALYSIGLPPELLGLSDLNKAEVRLILEHYPNFLVDLREATAFFDEESLKKIPPSVARDIRTTLRILKLDPQTDLIHRSLVHAVGKLIEKKDHTNIPELITQAARERKFLG